MAKKGGSKKNSPQLWQWLAVAVAAFLLYQGLEYLLSKKKPAPAKKPASTKISAAPVAKPPAPSPKPQASPGPLKQWNFQETRRLRPDGAYPDNYVPIPVRDKQSGLIAYAKLIPGKTPGPKGLTNTKPGLSFSRLEGEHYQTRDLDFSRLQEVLDAGILKKLSGLPEISANPVIPGAAPVYSARLFLGEDPREVHSFVVIDGDGLAWASVRDVGGQQKPAACVTGTTKLSTGELRTENRHGKTYIILEKGVLEEAKLHEGYRWAVRAYSWDGKNFVFDPDYSQTLSRQKTP